MYCVLLYVYCTSVAAPCRARFCARRKMNGSQKGHDHKSSITRAMAGARRRKMTIRMGLGCFYSAYAGEWSTAGGWNNSRRPRCLSFCFLQGLFPFGAARRNAGTRAPPATENPVGSGTTSRKNKHDGSPPSTRDRHLLSFEPCTCTCTH